MDKIRYKDLSFWLKVAVVSAWLAAIEFIIYFGIGFIEGWISI